MALEIERKFTISDAAWRDVQPSLIVQAYLNRDPERCVRIRIDGSRALLTVKGMAKDELKLEVPEFEYEIPLDDALQMLDLCGAQRVEKLRRKVPYAGIVWDVDEFLGLNSGLLMAEIELKSASEAFERPHWLLKEVTGDPRYFNSNLIERPYTTW